MNPILATYAQDVLDKNSDKILGSVTSFVKKAWEKFKVDFNLAFRTYINQSYDKYSKIKTILYRTEPQFIYDFFEVPYLQKGRKERFLADDVGNVISHSHFIIIEGTGGIGKSTLMKHLFLDTLRRGELIPIFIELKDLNDIDEDYSISDFIFKKLTGLGSTIDSNVINLSLLILRELRRLVLFHTRIGSTIADRDNSTSQLGIDLLHQLLAFSRRISNEHKNDLFFQ